MDLLTKQRNKPLHCYLLLFLSQVCSAEISLKGSFAVSAASIALVSLHTACKDASYYQLGLFVFSTSSDGKQTEFDDFDLQCVKYHPWQLQALTMWAVFEA